MSLTRMLAPAVLAASLGVAAVAAPAPAQAQSDDLVRVLVNVADVVMRGGSPYYRHGNYGYNDRLIVQRDRYGNPVYYRYTPRNNYGYYNNRGNNDRYRRTKCNKNGKCTVTYYDSRYDRDDRRYRYNNVRHDRYGRYWDGRRWRDRDDD